MKKSILVFPNSWRLVLLSIVVGALAFVGAEILVALINVFANLFFRSRLSVHDGFPLLTAIGWPLLFVPLLGSLVLGFKARYIDDRIRGHGIPEVIDRFTNHEGIIPARLLFLRPLASAISIGTGGPYGAEGPVIGLGGALGSVLGQIFRLDIAERRTLLCAGAAAGVSAIFGTPVGAIFLVLELFLRTHTLRSLLPIALASLVAYGFRVLTHGHAPLMIVQKFDHIEIRWVVMLVFLSVLVGATAAMMIHFVEFLERQYEKLPVHWMWWPVIGILPLAIVGIWIPRLLGPGYDLIADLGNVEKLSETLILLCLTKGLLWSIAVSSRTTGG
ncbi:MAG: chloride channel protein, partial [Bdellovibrionota bacterium]